MLKAQICVLESINSCTALMPTDISFGWILCYLCIDIHNINDCRWRQSRCYRGIDFCHWVLVDFRIVRCCRLEFVPSYLSFRSIALIDTLSWILSVAQRYKHDVMILNILQNTEKQPAVILRSCLICALVLTVLHKMYSNAMECISD